MAHPYVTSATIKGNYIEIGVEADNYKVGDYIEISGQATQSGGAFANFYDIKEVEDTAATTTIGDDGQKHYNVYVKAHPLPPNQFKLSEDVTIVIRVGKVWLTVLGRPYDPREEGLAAGNGAKWDELRKWSEVNRSSDWKNGYPAPKNSSSPFPADGSSSPADSSSPPA